jgi:hypothetical protein
LIFWTRPQRPKWMSAEQYATLPEELTLREVRIRVVQRGLRTRSLIVVTTLLGKSKGVGSLYSPDNGVGSLCIDTWLTG